jgi:hypothetical protein
MDAAALEALLRSAGRLNWTATEDEVVALLQTVLPDFRARADKQGRAAGKAAGKVGRADREEKAEKAVEEEKKEKGLGEEKAVEKKAPQEESKGSQEAGKGSQEAGKVEKVAASKYRTGTSLNL